LVLEFSPIPETDDVERILQSGKNYYSILDVPHDADLGMLKKQYKKFALSVHPDKNDNVKAEAAFKCMLLYTRLLLMYQY
jgi:hypothetical protein